MNNNPNYNNNQVSPAGQGMPVGGTNPNMVPPVNNVNPQTPPNNQPPNALTNSNNQAIPQPVNNNMQIPANNQANNVMPNTNIVVNNQPAEHPQPMPKAEPTLNQEMASNQDNNIEPQPVQITSINNENTPSLASMNIDGTYNKMNKQEEFMNPDPTTVKKEPKKKATIKITKDTKTFLIIALVILIFIIFIMPLLFDLMRNIKYH